MHALDNLCNPSGSMGGRTREFVHAWRVHPHTAGVGGNRADSTVGLGPQTRRLIAPGAGSNLSRSRGATCCLITNSTQTTEVENG